MKFDYIIGNPPYQKSRETTKDMPVYNYFMDESYKIAPVVVLIHPARFLFNGGATPKTWNSKMLNDEHFKVLLFEPDWTKIFSNTEIKGGIAVTIRNSNKNYGAIGTFTPSLELNNIKSKVINSKDFISLDNIMYPYSTFSFSENLWEDYPEKKEKILYISKNRNNLTSEEKAGELSNLRIITTNIFDLFPEIFFDAKPNDGQKYACLIGRQNNERCCKYVLLKYINVSDNYNKYKVLTSKTNGSGLFGEQFSKLIVSGPKQGYTQSFLGIGCFDTKKEAENLQKYISTKFLRALLGILKVTQDNPPEKWLFVPIQDFTNNSDIDWSKSIKEIDQQLYTKYNLSKEEIDFIESHVKEMQ